MRSKLFVPCSRPDFFSKALASDADALSFDLEDSVPADGKAAARERLGELLRSEAVAASNKRIIVRVNAPDTPYFADDLAALASQRLNLVNIPKVNVAADVPKIAMSFDQAGVAAPMLLNIETAGGLANVTAIANAHPKVAGIQAGLNDLFAALNMHRGDQANVHAALWSIRLGTAAAGETMPFAYDGAFPDLHDDDGYRAEAEMAFRLGFVGKSCIHPRQVAIANVVFERGGAVPRARRLLIAGAEAAARGHGAFAFEGEMIDEPALTAARALLADTDTRS